MKVIQTLGFYFPESSGGTEVYVDGLVNELNSQGVKSIVAAPQNGTQEITYEHNGVTVYRYPVFPNLTLEQIRGVTPHGGFEYFVQWLEQQKADIYHQHSWVTGCNIHHLRQAKKLGMRTVVTVHVPGNICLRGTMLLNGEKVCDGRIEQERCGTCWGIARGVPASVAPLLSRIPLPLSAIASSSLSKKRLATVLATRALVATHQNRLQEMVDLSDRIVAVCQWLYDALLLNGVAKEKLVLCRQGVDSTYLKAKPSLHNLRLNTNRPLKIGFLGRWDKIKGIHILVEAFSRLPSDLQVELVIHGLVQGEEGKAYQQEVLAKAAGDRRIQFADPVARHLIPETLASFDILAVPSQWLETGPLVVLEAYAMKTPILGSDIGGISELVTHNIDGLLVHHQNVKAWSEAILMLAKNKNLVCSLQQGIKSVRTMAEVGLDMSFFYHNLSNK